MIIIFGASGMLGRYVAKILSKNHPLCLVPRSALDLSETTKVKEWLRCNIKQEDIIVNCAGIIPQKSQDVEEMILVNTLFPLLLDKLDNKVIHVSSDCVYRGKETEPRSELWEPDAANLYGATKTMGEPERKTVIRTSIIGEGGGLLQWVLDNQLNEIQGYHHHFWNGVTCLQLAKVIDKIITENLFWTGIRHIHSEDMASKYILLKYIEDIYDLILDMECYCPEHIMPTYRILESIHSEIDWNIPSIPKQIKEQKCFDENYRTT